MHPFMWLGILQVGGVQDNTLLALAMEHDWHSTVLKGVSRQKWRKRKIIHGFSFPQPVASQKDYFSELKVIWEILPHRGLICTVFFGGGGHPQLEKLASLS